MANIGASTKYKHGIGSDKIYKMEERCFACNVKIYWNPWKEVKILYEDNPYCRRCYEQVTHGVKLAPYEKRIFIKTCIICAEEIKHFGNIPYCEEHMPEYLKKRLAYAKENRKEAKKVLGKKTQTTNNIFSQRDKNILSKRKGFAYCQNCKKIIEKRKAHRVTRSTDSLVMCSYECADTFRKSNSSEIWKIRLPRLLI